MIRLSPRLSAAARLAGTGESVIDVGTDHGYLPVYFIQSGAFSRVAASDINAGPLWSARCSARERGVEEKIEYYLSDGLRDVSGEFEAVVIAGMGGETMADILSACPWIDRARLILQPQSRLSELEARLEALGFFCAQAELALDAGKIYTLFEARAGAGDCDVPRRLMESRDRLMPEYLRRERRRLSEALSGMEQGGRQGSGQYFEAKRELETVNDYLTEAEKW